MRRNPILLFLLPLSVLLLGACAGGVTPAYCDPATLAPPLLTQPPDGGNYVLYTSHLLWSYPDGTCEPEGYKVEVNTASDFSGTTLGASTTMPNSFGWPIPLTPGTTYYWRVRATVGTSEGPWSDVWSFNALPACELSALVPPTPLFPSEGHEFMLDAPSYQWSYPDTACAPAGYHLQVSSDPAFTTIGLDMREENPETLWTPPAGTSLGDCMTWYWRVAAIDGGSDGPWSDPVSFSINVAGACPVVACELEDLVAPDPVAPAHYGIVNTLTPVLEWNYPGSCEPGSYAIRLSDVFDMSDTSLFGGTGTPDTSWAPGVPLEPATQYWWQVAGWIGTSTGPFSPKQTFFTGPECASVAETGAPDLISPADGATITEEHAWLHYSHSSAGCLPDGYFADLQTVPDFSGTNELGEFHIPGTNIITEALDDCTTYYWRIAAIQDGVQGPLSETRSFYTNFEGTCPSTPFRPQARAIKDLICRLGPGPQYDIAGYFLTEEVSPIHAQDLRHEWWVIENLDNPGQLCWVLKEGVEPQGDTSGVPMWNAPHEEAPAPQCRRDLSQAACVAAGGKWVPQVTNPGYCECP